MSDENERLRRLYEYARGGRGENYALERMLDARRDDPEFMERFVLASMLAGHEAISQLAAIKVGPLLELVRTK